MPPEDDLTRARRKRYRKRHLEEVRRKDRERKRNTYIPERERAAEAEPPTQKAFRAWVTGKDNEN